MPKKQIRIKMLGDAAVGKTSLLEKYFFNTFCDFYTATLGIMAYPGVDNKRLMICDTAGQERLHINSERWFGKDFDLTILVIEAANPQSLYDYYAKACSPLLNMEPSAPFQKPNIRTDLFSKIALIVTQSDVQLVSDLQEIKDFCKKNGIDGPYLTSAKQEDSEKYLSVKTVFDTIIANHKRVMKQEKNSIKKANELHKLPKSKSAKSLSQFLLGQVAPRVEGSPAIGRSPNVKK